MEAEHRGGQGGEPGMDDLLGHVLSVHGSQASVGLPAASLEGSDELSVTVGKFLRISRGTTLLIGMVTDVALEDSAAARAQGFIATAKLDMMGEIKRDETGVQSFSRGITNYPAIGDPAALIGNRELRLIYDISGSDTIDIGHLQQDETIGAYINVDEMLSKHFAILGTTGVGKSTGVALILREILQTRPNLRLFLLDGHNEYGRCFGDRAQILNPRNLKLPFWLFNFEETVDVFFGGRPGVEEEVVVLSELIPIAKSTYSQFKTRSSDRLAIKRSDPKSTGYTADTPVPYRLADLVGLIDERMGKLENRSSRLIYHKLITRIEQVRNDPRYTFMFDNANVGGDTMADTLRQLFRLPANGKPMTIMQLAGFPAEVVDSVVSVLGRMAFEFGLWSDGAFPLLFVCEEAHRYASADRSDRLRADPQGAVAHRQGGPQIRRVPRPGDAAPGGTRCHHHLAMLDAVLHAHGERSRPGAGALGGVRRRREPAGLRAVARNARSARLRRRRRAADPPEVQEARGAVHPAERGHH